METRANDIAYNKPDPSLQLSRELMQTTTWGVGVRRRSINAISRFPPARRRAVDHAAFDSKSINAKDRVAVRLGDAFCIHATVIANEYAQKREGKINKTKLDRLSLGVCFTFYITPLRSD